MRERREVKSTVRPIVVTAKGVVISGHARVLAAREAGIAEVPAVVLRHPDVRFQQEVSR